MRLAEEVIDSLKREGEICKIAIAHLKDKCGIFEKKYKMSTTAFLKRFNEGLLGDDEDFFKWHALAEGIKDWIKKQMAIREIW